MLGPDTFFSMAIPSFVLSLIMYRFDKKNIYIGGLTLFGIFIYIIGYGITDLIMAGMFNIIALVSISLSNMLSVAVLSYELNLLKKNVENNIEK